MLQVASDGGLLERPVSRTTSLIHPAERHRVAARLPRLPARLGDRAAERRRRVGGHEERHALRRRARRRRRGGRGSRRGRMRTLEKLPAPNASRRWDLSLATSSGVQWRIADRGYDPRSHRRPAAAGLERAVAVAQPVQPRAPDAPARDAVPDRRALHRRRPPGRPRLEGHDRRAAGRDGHGPAVVHALHRPLRVPLPRARARRQGHDAASWRWSDEARAAARLRRSALGRRRARRRRPSTVIDGHGRRSTWDKPNVAVAVGRDGHVDVPGHDAGPQRRSPTARDVAGPDVDELQRRRSACRRRPRRSRSRRRAPTSSSASCTPDTMTGTVHVGTAGAAAARRPPLSAAAVRPTTTPRRSCSRRSPWTRPSRRSLRCRPSAAPSAAPSGCASRSTSSPTCACASSAAARSSRPSSAAGTGAGFLDVHRRQGRPLQRRGAGDRRRRQPRAAQEDQRHRPLIRRGPLGSRRSRSDRRLRSPRSAGAGRGSARGR